MEHESLSLRSFGDLLKVYRKRKGLTQRRLAARLGIHYNTIYRWEQGDFLPETRGIVLELAKKLDLNDRETRQLLETSLLSFTFYWTIPAQRNPLFTGREELLAALHKLLRQHQSVTLTQALSLSGLGGVGKTQIALEYAYRHAEEYCALFWIDAETQESLLASMGMIASVLHLPRYTDQRHLVTTVKQWLTAHKNWLLIVDNIEHPELIKPILPASRNGCILYTTRLPFLWDLAQTLEVEPMTQEESVQFLLIPALQTNLEPSDEDRQSAAAMAVALGGLPLALDQARAYVQYTKCRLPDFLVLFERSPLQMLQEREVYADHPYSVTKTFLMAFEKLQREQCAAAELLILCCFFAPEEIPEALLTRYTSCLSPSLQAIVADLFHFNQAVKSLLSYSLIQRRPHRQTIVVHRLLQAVLKGHLPVKQQQAWNMQLIHLLNQAFPQDQKHAEAWPWCDQMLPHILHCLDETASWAPSSPDLCRLLAKTAAYLAFRARYTMAEPLYQRALALLEQEPAPTYPGRAFLLNSLARVQRRLGKYDAAEQGFRCVLTLLESDSHADPLEFTNALLGLATLCWDLRRFQECETLFRRGLELREHLQGETHPDLAIPLNNFANLFFSQGKYTEAETIYLRSLQISEQARGPDHPDTALPLANLGMLYIVQERLAEAETFSLRALRIREQSLGEAHLANALTLNNLSVIYVERGQYAEAETVLRRALSIQEQVLSSVHLQLYPLLDNLGDVCYKQGKPEEAETYYLQSLNMLERIPGLTGYETIGSLKGLATVYTSQKRYKEAEIYYQRAVAILSQEQGAHSLYRVETYRSLAAFYRSQGRLAEAEIYDQRALEPPMNERTI